MQNSGITVDNDGMQWHADKFNLQCVVMFVFAWTRRLVHGSLTHSFLRFFFQSSTASSRPTPWWRWTPAETGLLLRVCLYTVKALEYSRTGENNTGHASVRALSVFWGALIIVQCFCGCICSLGLCGLSLREHISRLVLKDLVATVWKFLPSALCHHKIGC